MAVASASNTPASCFIPGVWIHVWWANHFAGPVPNFTQYMAVKLVLIVFVQYLYPSKKNST